MNASDRTGFYKTWGGVAEVYGKELSDTALKINFDLLSDYSLEDVSEGIVKHCKNTNTGQFMPKASCIILQIQGNPEDRAIEAWATVLPLMTGGTDNFLVFDDWIIHKVVKEMGGFKYLGSGTEPTHYLAMRFKENYVAIARGPQENRSCPPRLWYAGSAVFGPNSTVRYIGNKEKCLMLEQKAEKENESLEWITESMKLISSDNELPF